MKLYVEHTSDILIFLCSSSLPNYIFSSLREETQSYTPTPPLPQMSCTQLAGTMHSLLRRGPAPSLQSGPGPSPGTNQGTTGEAAAAVAAAAAGPMEDSALKTPHSENVLSQVHLYSLLLPFGEACASEHTVFERKGYCHCTDRTKGCGEVTFLFSGRTSPCLTRAK